MSRLFHKIMIVEHTLNIICLVCYLYYPSNVAFGIRLMASRLFYWGFILCLFLFIYQHLVSVAKLEVPPVSRLNSGYTCLPFL